MSLTVCMRGKHVSFHINELQLEENIILLFIKIAILFKFKYQFINLYINYFIKSVCRCGTQVAGTLPLLFQALCLV